jgi:rhodanese-related sulfurtransferase
MFEPEFRADLPAIWRLTEPIVVDEQKPDDVDYEPFSLLLAEVAGSPAQIVFSANSVDEGAGELEPVATVLMEVAARLPDESGLDAAVWYMSNVWAPQGAGQKTDLPCLVREFDGGAMVVWSGGDGDQLTSFFGSVTHFDGDSADVEQCRALQAQVASAVPAAEPAEPTGTPSDGVGSSIAPDEAAALIKAGEHIVIDVRTPGEFEAAHVVGALNIDVEAPDFAERISELETDASYLVYCRSGRRSALAASQMDAAGFTEVVDAGALVELARAGAPIE